MPHFFNAKHQGLRLATRSACYNSNGRFKTNELKQNRMIN